MAYDFDFSEHGYSFDPDFLFGIEQYVLKAPTNTFVAIWAEDDAGLYNGKFYAASESTLNIVDLSKDLRTDWFSKTRPGSTEDTLTSEDIMDIAVVG